MKSEHPLRTWRENVKPRPLSQADLGALLGIGASQISHIENRMRSCSLDVAIKIKALTGGAVPLESLLSKEAVQ